MSHDPTQTSEYDEGYEAFLEGEGLDDNPYGDGGWGSDWRAGWEAAKRDSNEE